MTASRDQAAAEPALRAARPVLASHWDRANNRSALSEPYGARRLFTLHDDSWARLDGCWLRTTASDSTPGAIACPSVPRLAGIRYDPLDPRRSDLDLWAREITVRGKGGKARVVRIGHEAARALDRYMRVRSRHGQAWRRELWLGMNNRGPMTANGIYQMISRRGQQAGIDAWTHRFRHHFSHTWLDRGGSEGDLMELNGWSSPQMLRRYGASARSARARRTYDRIMESGP